MHGKLPILMLLVLAAGMSGCQKKPVKFSPDGSALPAPAAAPMEPFTLTIASGGGFTGLYSGCALQSDGTVTFWQRIGARPDSILAKAAGSPAEIQGLLDRLRLGGALASTLRESGNMTTVVKLEIADSVRTWSWAGSGVDDKTPEPFMTWYPEAQAYCSGLFP